MIFEQTPERIKEKEKAKESFMKGLKLLGWAIVFFIIWYYSKGKV